MPDEHIVFTTSSDTKLGTSIAKGVAYNGCKELRSPGGRISHWRVSGTTTGSVEIDDDGAGCEIFLVPGANIQTRHTLDGVEVMFSPKDVTRVVSLDDPHDLVPVYQNSTSQPPV
jgi:hypothetical protein